LTVAYFAYPDQHLYLSTAFGLTGAAAIVVGVRLHRPAHPAAWWLLAAALTVYTFGGTTADLRLLLLGPDAPHPSRAATLHAAIYPIGGAGLMLLVRHRTGGRDRGSLLDALTLTVAVGLLSWIFLIEPYVDNEQLSWLQRAASISLPLGDVLLLAVLVRLI